MKRIKSISVLLVALFSFFTGAILVSAETLSVSATASATSTVVGNSVTITFKYSSTKPLGAVVYSMSYDSNYLTLTSGTQSNALSYTGTAKSDTVKYVFKAKKKGETTVKLNFGEALDFDGNPLSVKSVSKTITIKTQADIEASYSKNNNLSSLKVNKGTLSPEFNKNTLEYSVTVENEVDKIAVSGSKEDSKSYVDGLKEYNLEEGNNRIEVRVTAQNGSSKVYVINVTRKELSPIIVKDENNVELTVVRKKELLKSPNSFYVDSTVTIENEEIPALFNESTNTYLVGLKDSDGTVSLYTFEDNKYTPYKELTFDSIILTTIDAKNIPEGYVETKIIIGENEVVAYKEQNKNNYYLLSGINIETGEEHLYQYDKNEKTIQIFDKSTINKILELKEKNNNYLYVIIGLGSLLIITYLVLLISIIKGSRKKKKKKKDFDFEDEPLPIIEEKEEKKEIDLDNTTTLQEKKVKRKKDSKEKEKNNKKDDTI